MMGSRQDLGRMAVYKLRISSFFESKVKLAMSQAFVPVSEVTNPYSRR